MKKYFIYRFLEYYSFFTLGKFDLDNSLNGRTRKRLPPQEVIKQIKNVTKESNSKIKLSIGGNYS